MEFIGIGDLHLTDATEKGGLSEYIRDHDDMVRREVEKVKAYARKEGVTRIIQYGDVFEGPRASYSGMLSLLDMLTEDDIEWTFILGNHDKFAEDSALGHSLELLQRWRLAHVKVITKPRRVSLGKSALNFMPWPCVDFVGDALNVAHVDVEGAMRDNGRVTKSAVKHQGRSVIGHIHTHQEVGRGRNVAHYSGTLYQTNFGESPEKFFHHARWDGGWEIESVAHQPDYKLTTLEVSTPKDLRQIDTDPNHLYKLKVLNAKALTTADYGSNVVRVTPVSAKGEEIELDPASAGEAVELDPDEFFESWVNRQSVGKAQKAAAIQLRKEMLCR